ncbi:hypothetical protein [Wolbachia endosymbiont of Chironomus riparius]|uniref:hypothetical protein n=1 Tax=Wolbachia endosymbiont of Chironomus riparius TaxID=2883238 RepID=UPI00209D2D2D|nr:hypothetical protein [Wolbachia endosymbiont of Chironomus riparius]
MSGNKLLIIEVLSGRILHDFANSMNSIVFGLEECKVGDQKAGISLIQKGFDHLFVKYKVMKQAYSASGDNLSFYKTKSNIENYLLKKKLH